MPVDTVDRDEVAPKPLALLIREQAIKDKRRHQQEVAHLEALRDAIDAIKYLVGVVFPARARNRSHLVLLA